MDFHNYWVHLVASEIGDVLGSLLAENPDHGLSLDRCVCVCVLNIENSV